VGVGGKKFSKVRTINQIIDHWIRLEHYTKEEYSFLAEGTKNPHARIVFTRLACAGECHANILKHVKNILAKEGENFQPVKAFHLTDIPTPGKKQGYPTEVEETYHAIKGHVKLEQEMERGYTRIRPKIRSRKAKTLFQVLAEEEKQHHQQLLALIQVFEKIYKSLLKK
jgi:rubrerythrin